MRRWLVLLGVVVLAAGGLFFFRRGQDDTHLLSMIIEDSRSLSGTNVVVSDGDGRIIGTGVLDSIADTSFIVSVDVPEVDFYKITIGGRAAGAYSLQQIQAAKYYLHLAGT